MNSPLTGKPMELRKEPRVMVFRKKEYMVNYHYYRDVDQALRIMERVSRRFKDMNTQEVVALSHQEPAWKDNQAAFPVRVP